MSHISRRSEGLTRKLASSGLTDDIRHKISAGILRAGDILLSEKSLSQQYRISIVSVRRALKELQEEGLIEKKWGKGNFVSGPSKQTKYVGVIVPNLTNPIFSEFLREITHQASELDYHIIVADANNRIDKELSFINNFAERGIKKILKFPNLLPQEERVRKIMTERRMHYVIINDFWTSLPGQRVRFDETLGTRLAMEHLLSLGHRKIAYIDYEEELRENIYRTYQGCLEEGRSRDDDFVLLTDPGKFLHDGVEFLLRMRGRVTACLLPYDLFAIHFMEELSLHHGYDFPEDLAVIGFDDLYESSKPNISLTTVRPPKDQIVRKALELVLSPAADRSSILVEVEPELVIRNSTAGKQATKEKQLVKIGEMERRWAI